MYNFSFIYCRKHGGVVHVGIDSSRMCCAPSFDNWIHIGRLVLDFDWKILEDNVKDDNWFDRQCDGFTKSHITDDVRRFVLDPIIRFKSCNMYYTVYSDGAINRNHKYLYKLPLNARARLKSKNSFRIGRLVFENTEVDKLIEVFNAVVHNMSQPIVSLDNSQVIDNYKRYNNFNLLQEIKWHGNGKLDNVCVSKDVMGIIFGYIYK